MKAIFRLHFDAGRMGSLSGIFVAEEGDMSELINSKKEIHFGEVLGKHSEIGGTIEEKDIEKITNDEVAVVLFERYEMAIGYNPFDYIEDDDAEEGEEG